MPLYEVTLQIDDPALALTVQEHMRQEHIPDIFATGCFQRISFDQASPERFRTRYEARSASDLDRYLREHAPRLRVTFQALFTTGVTITRETWSVLESWG
ncbi:MAG: DUF4286 family protein [Gemmatimonadales bacterium]